MRKFKKMLLSSLKDIVPKNKLQFLPAGFQKIGDIVIVSISPGLERWSKEIGETILKQLKVKTVCQRTGGIKGKVREPSIKVLAGNGTETIHRENNCFYKIDVVKLMFAKGNVRERGRLADLVRPGETIVDMFAGIGYFCLPIAKRIPGCKIYAIDINPNAIKFLKENCRLNRISNIEIVQGDCRRVAGKMEGVADRVIMGYIKDTKGFLPSAFKFLKEMGTIHYHFLSDKRDFKDGLEDLEKVAGEHNYRIDRVLEKVVVKSYAPGVWHLVADVKFKSF